jgi:hypothetical protein
MQHFFKNQSFCVNMKIGVENIKNGAKNGIWMSKLTQN